MRIDESNNKHLTADEGKVFRRLSDGWMAGGEIHLGMAYHLGGERLETPLEERPEHYEEIDGPAADEPAILTDGEPLRGGAPPDTVALAGEPPPPGGQPPADTPKPPRVTLADYRALEEKVARMMELLGINE